jgi:hypothetical protein
MGWTQPTAVVARLFGVFDKAIGTLQELAYQTTRDIGQSTIS